MMKADHLLGQGEYLKAEPFLRQHLRAKPNDPLANEWLGGVLMFTNRFEQGLFFAVKAVETSDLQTPADVASRRQELLGNLYLKLARPDEALAHATKAVQILPTAHAYNLVAAVHLICENLGKAFEPCRRAYELNPHEHTIVSNYAMLLGELGQAHLASAVLLKAMRERGHPASFHSLVPSLNYPVPTPPGVSVPDPLPASPDDPDCIDAMFKRRCAEQYGGFLEQLGQEELRGCKHLHKVTNFDPSRPLRVGIASYDMRMHSCAYFMRALLKHLPRPGLTLVGIYNSSQFDEITKELKSYFHEWLHLPGAIPPAIAMAVADAKIDVLIECGGYTAHSPMFACAVRPAPVQVTYLGYPGTTGLRSMNYRVVDERTDPSPTADAQCTEKLVRLPNSFLCFDAGHEMPEPRDPAVLGPADTTQADGQYRPLVFGSFSTAIKLSRATYDQWCSVLHAVPRSRMLIKATILGTPQAAQYALDQFASRGIDPSRVEIIARVKERKDHMRIYDRMDIALDTYPYVGTTTICESLLMSVPYLSRYGHQHINRVGYSLLSAVGVPELACPTLDALVELAKTLDADRAKLRGYHATLRSTLLASSVCDGVAYANNFADAIRRMWVEETKTERNEGTEE
jgi:hypothetical protein